MEVALLKYIKSSYKTKTPLKHSRMYRQIAAGFLIRKMLSDLLIIFSIRNVRNVLVKLLDFSVKALRILSVIDIHSSSISHL